MVSHGVCPSCKNELLSKHGEAVADPVPERQAPGKISKQAKHLEEYIFIEEVGLEKDIEGMIKRIKFFQNNHEKLAYIKAARRVIALLAENRFSSLSGGNNTPA